MCKSNDYIHVYGLMTRCLGLVVLLIHNNCQQSSLEMTIICIVETFNITGSGHYIIDMFMFYFKYVFSILLILYYLLVYYYALTLALSSSSLYC